MIKNIDKQVEKAIKEIEMRYLKGTKFDLHMLTVSVLCCDSFNYDNYIKNLSEDIVEKGIAKFYCIDKGNRIYIKL